MDQDIEKLMKRVEALEIKLNRNTFTTTDRRVKAQEFVDGTKIRFLGQTTQYEIYRAGGDNKILYIDAATDYSNEGIEIGGIKKPLHVYITGGDEAVLRANNNTNNTYLLVEPTVAGFYTNGTNKFRLRFPNLASDPVAGFVGDLCVVSGKLKICTSIGPVVYTTVGTQT